MSEPSSKLFRDDPAAYYTELGAERERERLIQLLEEYLEVTQLPGDYGIEINKEWDAGFNAALALIKGEQK